MRVALPLDQTNRVEVLFEKPSLKVKDLAKLDSIMCSTRAPALVIDPAYINDIIMIKGQRNSKYNVIAAIDLEGKVYGGNKVYHIKNAISADGFDIGLTANKNKTELTNEIKAITSFLSQSPTEYMIRWVINAKHGSGHVKECLEAIKKSKTKFDMISLITDSIDADLAHDLVKTCRTSLGLAKCKMKISGDPSNDLIRVDNSLRYQVAADLLL